MHYEVNCQQRGFTHDAKIADGVGAQVRTHGLRQRAPALIPVPAGAEIWQGQPRHREHQLDPLIEPRAFDPHLGQGRAGEPHPNERRREFLDQLHPHAPYDWACRYHLGHLGTLLGAVHVDQKNLG